MRSCVGPVNIPPSSVYRVRSSGWFSTRPPTRVRASSTSTERPAAAIARAAVRPARPAPTTMTSAVSVAACPDFGSAVIAAPAAAPRMRPRRVIPLVFMVASGSALNRPRGAHGQSQQGVIGARGSREVAPSHPRSAPARYRVMAAASLDLTGKVALVTGASRGVGRALALALADAGVDVACAARATDAAPLKLPGPIDPTVRDVEERGRRGLAIPVDLARPGAPEAMVQHAADAFGRLDILVNNAAITFDGDLALPMKRWDLVMEVNVRAPLLAMRAALPIMKRAGQGRILNISSAAAVLPIRGLLVYGVSKAALERLTIGAAEETVADGVAVNCLRIDDRKSVV